LTQYGIIEVMDAEFQSSDSSSMEAQIGFGWFCGWTFIWGWGQCWSGLYLCTRLLEGKIKNWVPANHGWTPNPTSRPSWTMHYITARLSKTLPWFMRPESLHTACSLSLAVLRGKEAGPVL